MSMLALPENECHEILSLFRQHLPHIPNVWLQEVAANYGLDAVVDIDPNDVIAILSVPGELHRLEIPLADHVPPAEIYRRMSAELMVRRIETGRIVASLLTIHGSSAKLADVGELVGLLQREITAVEKGWAWYSPRPDLSHQQLVWTVTTRKIQVVKPWLI